MKKVLTLVFCVMLAILAAGCGQDSKSAGTESTQEKIIAKANKAASKQDFAPAGEIKEGRKNVYAVLKVMKGAYWEQVIKGLKEGAAAADCNLYIGGALKEADFETQRALLDELAGKKADAVVLAPSDSLQMIMDADKLQKNNVPLVLVDSALNSKSISAAYLTNNYDAGEKAAEEMIKLLKENGVKESDKAAVAIKVSNLNAQNLVERVEGINACWHKHAPANWELITKVDVDFGDKETCKQLLADAVQSRADLKGVIACNNSTTAAVAEALAAKNDKKLALVGFDYAKATAAAIASPELKAASIVQNQYTMGLEAVKTAVALSKGQKPAAVNNDTGVMVVDSSNYKAYEAKM